MLHVQDDSLAARQRGFALKFQKMGNILKMILSLKSLIWFYYFLYFNMNSI